MSNTRYKWTDEFTSQLVRRYDDGETVKEIADDLGLTSQYLYLKFRKIPGWVPRKRGPMRKWTQDKINTMLAEYRSGLSIREIAELWGAHPSHVYRLIASHPDYTPRNQPRVDSWGDEEIADVVNRRIEGETLQSIARDYDVSRERIRQIVNVHTDGQEIEMGQEVRNRKRAEQLAQDKAEIWEWVQENPGYTMKEVAGFFDVHPWVVRASIPEKESINRYLLFHQPGTGQWGQSWSDEEVIEGLRKAAAEFGDPLSSDDYEIFHKQNREYPSVTVVQRKMGGTWNEACRRAGLSTNIPLRGYTRQWNEQDMISAVADYLLVAENPTAHGYNVWSAVTPGKNGRKYPSLPTIRQQLGPWNGVKKEALKLLQSRGE